MSNDEKKENDNKKGIIVLGVYIHCEGCVERVRKSLKGYNGVQTVEVDSEKNRVNVKAGEKTDPTKIAKRVRKKTGKHVELISPKINPNEKKEVKKEEKKEPKIVEVVLKTYLHCEGCAISVKKTLHKMPGVHTVETDIDKNQVKVKGTIEGAKVVEFVSRREGKHAELVKTEKEKEPKKEDQPKKDKGNEDLKKFYSQFHPELVYAPSLFSDENPNSCSVM
ncbi:OLC1v1028632C1 [Oldenlandia corymbosa var. corymbosa]|uniref:OLC1v1028632C1 n=1 Tax=Oldenlandia corymbosa var. corymbosa TaxID=529605 RepID=A0AAV1CEZ5_OLDCO|nr:OLC1v1028632C1 [Oldenlandia corymbosa var. corymbosa]